MRKYLPYFTVLFLIIAINSKAQDNPQGQQTRLKIEEKNLRRTLIESWIDCYYIDGQLYLNPSEEIGDMYVSITNMSTGVCRNYDISADDAVIFVTLSNDSYYIECTTKQGVTYAGDLYIE